MKKIVLCALLATGLAPAASAALTTGFEVGYLTENQDAYWSGHVGWEFKTTATYSHQVELELGYTEQSESFAGSVSGNAKRTPIMINYRAETTVTDKLGYYFGGGIGQSWTKITTRVGSTTFPSYSETGQAIQAFAGVRYKATDTVTLHAGAKYLKMNEANLPGVSVERKDDIALTVGVSIKF